MLEPGGGPTGLFGQGYFPPSGNESCEEEELSVLPRHTKVIVTGNNRTKSVLVGLHGVVKKAVGLGGWHWLVLTNGAEVKLQRNALSVIEAPTGHEEDDDIENPFSNETNIDDYPRSFKPRVRPQKPAYEMPRTADSSVESVSLKRCERKTETGIRSYSNSFPIVDLGKLDTSSLRKYRRHFKLFDVDPNCSKEQLLRAVGRHFISYQPDEWRVISGFVDSVKRQRT